MSAHSGARDVARFRWYATINNFTEEDIDQLSSLPHKELVIGREEAPSTGTPHLHVYISLEKKERLQYMKSACSRAHWEPVKDRSKCIEYCMKDGVIVRNELLQKPQKRELSEAIACMQSEGLAGVARAFPYQYSLHSRGLRDLQYALIDDIEKPVPQVWWFYGNTGTGKTRAAFELVDQNNIFLISPPNSKGSQIWFDGYMGQSVAVFDDFRPWWCRFDYLLRLLDRYPLRVPVKGGFVNWVPEIIIITTQKSIKDTFTGEFRTDEDLRQLERRVTRRVHFVTLEGCSQVCLPNEELYCYDRGRPNTVELGVPSPFGHPSPLLSCHSMQIETGQIDQNLVPNQLQTQSQWELPTEE